MGAKKTQEQFEKELHDAFPKIQVKGIYNGTKELVKMKCKIDGHEWDVLPGNVMRSGCPVCNGSIITTESFKQEIKEKHPNLEILGEWNGNKGKIKYKCTKCNEIFEYAPRTIRETGCPKCSNSPTRRYTHNEYVKKVKELCGDSVEVLEPYINMNTKIKHKCLIHNEQYDIKPSKLLIGQTSCKKCKNKKIEQNGKNKRKPQEIFEEELKKLWGNEIQLISGYTSTAKKAYFIHNTSTPHTFYIAPNSLTSAKQGCPICAGNQVCVGYNDFNTKYPELSKRLKNIEDGYKYTEQSNEKVYWVCNECGYEEYRSFCSMVHKNGRCPCCDDGYSYPNKFMFNSLLQIKEELDFLDREYNPEWCEFEYNGQKTHGIYDIYFVKNSKLYVVEMDGALGHGEKVYKNSEVTLEETIFKDKEKDRLAKEHGIKVIRIDCKYKNIKNRYEYILNNILNSELKEILDLSKIDFKKASLVSQNSMLIEAVKMWNEGYKISDIAEELHVIGTTVQNYLQQGKKHGICDSYSPKESKYRSNCNSVVCLNTRKHFRSIVDGGKEYGINESDISKCCRRKATFGGWYNGEKMYWMYEEEYNKLTEEEIKSYIPKEDGNYVKVVCLNTQECFDGLKYGAEKYGMKCTSSITACCKGYVDSAGKDENGVPLRWRYLEDYVKMSQQEIKEILEYKKMGKKPVICLNTLQVFDNAFNAKEWCNLNSKLPIQRCCRGETKVAGRHPQTNEELQWMYYKDYIKLYGEVG